MLRKVRPGLIIKGVLSGEIQLTNGSIVNEACCTDIHNVYKSLVKSENIKRKSLGKRPLHGMTVNSFVRLMAFARLLGLIEFAREEPFRGHGGPLYRVDKSDCVITAKVVQRRLYRLTDKGKDELTMWDDLTTAYKKSLIA